jgi:hypothetical protein
MADDGPDNRTITEKNDCATGKNSPENGSTSRDELERLERFHQQVAAADNRRKIDLLRNGCLPESSEALLAAGFKCLPLIDPQDSTEEPATSAAIRLRTIIALLQDQARASDETAAALTRFAASVNIFERIKSRDTQQSCLLFVAIPIFIGLVIWYFITR